MSGWVIEREGCIHGTKWVLKIVSYMMAQKEKQDSGPLRGRITICSCLLRLDWSGVCQWASCWHRCWGEVGEEEIGWKGCCQDRSWGGEWLRGKQLLWGGRSGRRGSRGLLCSLYPALTVLTSPAVPCGPWIRHPWAAAGGRQLSQSTPRSHFLSSFSWEKEGGIIMKIHICWPFREPGTHNGLDR